MKSEYDNLNTQFNDSKRTQGNYLLDQEKVLTCMKQLRNDLKNSLTSIEL